MTIYDDHKPPRWNYQLIFEKSKIRDESEVLDKKNDQESTKPRFRKKAITMWKNDWCSLCRNEYNFFIAHL